MHRSVSSDDVIKYSTGARKRDIKLTKEEDIEYRDDFLYHSSGDTSLKFQRELGEEGSTLDENRHSLSDAFSARGSYTLDLRECFVQSEVDKARQRRSLNDKLAVNMKEEGLKVHFNKSKLKICHFVMFALFNVSKCST